MPNREVKMVLVGILVVLALTVMILPGCIYKDPVNRDDGTYEREVDTGSTAVLWGGILFVLGLLAIPISMV